MRKTERVIIRTEEPISLPQDEASVSSAGSSRSSADESLRHGTVEETDEGLRRRTWRSGAGPRDPDGAPAGAAEAAQRRRMTGAAGRISRPPRRPFRAFGLPPAAAQ